MDTETESTPSAPTPTAATAATTTTTTTTMVAKNEKSERYAFIVSRRESLEAKLQEKNYELKRLCIAEAELTGVMPPEIPLEPGESVPTFRRRVKTSYTLPENLINKLKSEEDQTVSQLEVELGVQSSITAAALALLNDGSLKKGLRKQRRYEYQQSQRRLHEIENQLAQAKINQAASQKQRKKPRPSVDGESVGEPADREEGGVIMSPSKSASALNGGYLDVHFPNNNTIPHSHSFSYTHVHDLKMAAAGSKAQLERMHATAPQYRMRSPSSNHRPLLQRLGSGGPSPYGPYQHSHPHYPTLSSCTLPELERLKSTGLVASPHWTPYSRDCELKPHLMPPHDECRVEMEPPPSRLHVEGRGIRWNRNGFGSLDRKKRLARGSPALESRSVEGGLDALPSETDLPDAETTVYVFPRMAHTLDKVRVKEEHATHRPVSREEPRQQQQQQQHRFSPHHHRHHHTLLPVSKLHKSPHSVNPPVSTGEALLPGQTYPEHSFGPLPSQGLTRTQSLGSVETPSSVVNHVVNADTRSIKDMFPSTSYTQQKNYDASLRKLKEKEWYESSLDGPSHPPLKPPSRRPSGHSLDVKSQTLEVRQCNSSNSSLSMYNSSIHSETKSIHLGSESKFDHHPSVPYNPSIRSFDSSSSAHEAHHLHHHSGSSVQEVHHMRHHSGTSSVQDVHHLHSSMQEAHHLNHSGGGGTLQEAHLHHLQQLQVHTPEETHIPKTKSEMGDHFDTVVPFESPKNHMVIQAGMWQPYWEVTKPFEMSDFYKYSTKFRKKQGQEDTPSPSRVEERPPLGTGSPSPMSPQQKGIYQPLQPMTCQPLEATLSQHSPKPFQHPRAKALSPTAGLDSGSPSMPNTESLADAFSTEMLAWYQDQSNVPRSATLV